MVQIIEKSDDETRRHVYVLEQEGSEPRSFTHLSDAVLLLIEELPSGSTFKITMERPYLTAFPDKMKLLFCAAFHVEIAGGIHGLYIQRKGGCLSISRFEPSTTEHMANQVASLWHLRGELVTWPENPDHDSSALREVEAA